MITEKEYRQLKIDSYSTLKDFAKNRKAYYKKYILDIDDEEEEEDDSQAMIIGNLVDCLRTSEQEFDNRYYVSTAPEAPTAMMAKFINELYRVTISSVVDGVVSKEFNQLAEEAYNAAKFDKNGQIVAFKRDKLETVVKNFDKYKEYYAEQLAVRPTGKIVISNQDLENATRINDELLTNEFTAHITKKKTNEKWEIIRQFPVFPEIDGIELKGLLDECEVNHEEKYIQPYDYKVTWNVEDFYEKYYLYRMSFIQGKIYDQGLKQKQTIEKWYEDYNVRPMKFIVADSINYMNPLIYPMEDSDLIDAYTGFEHKGRKYKGLGDILKDLKWAKETNIWNISRENYLNRGICKLKK